MKSIYKYIISILLILTSMSISVAIDENTSTNELLSDDYGARYIPDNIEKGWI